MRKKSFVLGGSLALVIFAASSLQAQSHILYGDVTVHEDKAAAAARSSFRLTLTSITGIVVGRQVVSNGGRYRFLSVANGDYILTVELGVEEIARLELLVNEMRPTDIRRNLELEWKSRFPVPRKKPPTELVYARSTEQAALLSEARAAQASEDHLLAEELLVQLTTMDENDFEAWTDLGTSLFHLDRLKPAEAAYSRAIALQPQLPVAHQNLGKLYIHQRRFERAIEELGVVVTQSPDRAEAHLLLGEAYLQVQKGSLAVPHLERAIELEPLEMATAHLRLATLYRVAGYADLAVQEFRKYLEKVPDFSGKKEIEQYIAKNSSSP